MAFLRFENRKVDICKIYSAMTSHRVITWHRWLKVTKLFHKYMRKAYMIKRGKSSCIKAEL